MAAFSHTGNDTIIARSGIVQDKSSPDWLKALKSRLPAQKVDSISRITKEVTKEEAGWKKVIESKTGRWNAFRDSLGVPFNNIHLTDTVYILTGYGGDDDGFTYGLQTVCFDLTALQREYGNAVLPENDNRLDRLFAHEYTHLLHKAWAVKAKYEFKTFRDSILWECLYEGMGMYRSLNARWLPVKGSLPEITKTTLNELYPVFSNRINTIQSGKSLSNDEKIALHRNLSRGPVNKKWGAFPVGIWLALEANGNDKNLAYLIDLGPEAVLYLSKKYKRLINL